MEPSGVWPRAAGVQWVQTQTTYAVTASWALVCSSARMLVTSMSSVRSKSRCIDVLDDRPSYLSTCVASTISRRPSSLTTTSSAVYGGATTSTRSRRRLPAASSHVNTGVSSAGCATCETAAAGDVLLTAADDNDELADILPFWLYNVTTRISHANVCYLCACT